MKQGILVDVLIEILRNTHKIKNLNHFYLLTRTSNTICDFRQPSPRGLAVTSQGTKFTLNIYE